MVAKPSLARSPADAEADARVSAHALELAKDCHAAYVGADANVRRLLNQSFFEKIYVRDDGQVTHDLAEPFKIPLDPELAQRLAAAVSDDELTEWTDYGSSWPHESGPVDDEAAGSNMKVLVDLTRQLSNLRFEVQRLVGRYYYY